MEVVMTASRKRGKIRAPKVKTLLRPAEDIAVHFDDPLLTPEQVARRLGVANDTLTLWRCTERVALPYTKVGRLVRYYKSDVEAFLQKGRVVPSTMPAQATA
jgi:excisionase family DNA binding protein